MFYNSFLIIQSLLINTTYRKAMELLEKIIMLYIEYDIKV